MTRSSWFISLLLLFAVTTARAAADDEDAQYKQHYEGALRLYGAQRYDEAIKEFEAAYKIRPRPGLLFNMGQASRNLGNAKEALRYYLVYQASEPNRKPWLESELQGYISQMKEIVVRAERAQRAESNAAVGSSPAPDPQLPPPAEVVVPALVTASSTPAPPRFYRRGWFWGVVAGGVVAVAVVGLTVGLTTSRFDGPSWAPRFAQ